MARVLNVVRKVKSEVKSVTINSQLRKNANNYCLVLPTLQLTMEGSSDVKVLVLHVATCAQVEA
jgi:hypothetical protein